MFGNNYRKPKKSKHKRFRWLRGVVFGGILATLLTSLFTPRSGLQLRKKLSRVRYSGTKKGKVLLKNTKQHAKTFAKQTKLLAKSISKEIKEFAKIVKDESRD
ncbi:YtxH domain-containing protein [Chlamydia sp. 17-3921]|uniref:YtxH domain-containing protein n=1 Tax=Chlamydia sp. 17-3921 TaxID=2675798 RepID=UPI00191B48E2|nr:YtxH domain-containing protein [Chlamydia sp. 17-3921]